MTPPILLLIVALVAGEPHDAGTKQGTVKLSIGVHSSSPSIGFGEGATVHIDSVWLTMRDLRFLVSCKAGASTIAIAGPITVELVTGRMTGVPDSLKLDAGRYCAFGFGFRQSRGKSDDAPKDLKGASIVIHGRRADGVRFVIRCRLDTSPRLSAADIEGFAISEATTQLILSADVARWFAGLDLSIAEITGEAKAREIRIDDDKNSELLTQFRTNIEAGLALYLDRDGDRHLDESDRAHPIASGGR